MKTLLDVLRENLPADVTIKNEKETTNRFKYSFCFGTASVPGEICKVVAPGFEKSYVCRVIATHMAQIHLSSGNLEQAQYWLNASQQNDASGADEVN